jgi:glutamate--cysteine ligase
MYEGMAGQVATASDWELHLSTLFPEVRLKPFIEVRGCDAGSLPMALAVAPLMRGILYDDIARAEATLLTASLDFSQRVDLLRAVARVGLSARVPGLRYTVLDLARRLVAIAEDGLARQAPDELRYLEPVRAIVATGRTQSDDLVDLWQRSKGDPARVIAARAHRLPG